VRPCAKGLRSQIIGRRISAGEVAPCHAVDVFVIQSDRVGGEAIRIRRVSSVALPNSPEALVAGSAQLSTVSNGSILVGLTWSDGSWEVLCWAADARAVVSRPLCATSPPSLALAPGEGC
jgi:hypothetical protein